ncbi:helix-turn-helix domain-containing protein [Marinirhabdus gelatinilytica]|uniref:Helix-turn-helix protein n=1 Tax=Marinirhabdus gelatinilytica TaxID=1703343 RepID=A0A370Q543_9FLAO|nr:helix-turn-helix domain-containing protein [Marinirhabdus gelatinilytica]RDK83491.1 helix-turn-helix protein [Marinirhabdus gelatinilytica]
MKYLYSIFFLLCTYVVAGQEAVQDKDKLSQSRLNSLGDEALLHEYNIFYGDSIAQEKIARTYLERGRKEGDTIKMARGYDRLARIFHPEKNIRFADSILEISKNQRHKFYPAMGYLLKAYSYNKIDDFENFYLNIEKGYNKAKELDNLSLQVYASSNLVYYKSIWGDPAHALTFQKNIHKLILSDSFKQRMINEARKTKRFDLDSMYRIEKSISYQNLVHCYIYLRKLDSARLYNKNLRETVIDFEQNFLDRFISWSQATQMEIEYFDGNYEYVIELGESFLKNDSISKKYYKKDLLLYLGLAQYQKGNRKRGVNNLLKVDSIFSSHGMKDFFPYERLVYEKLIEHSKGNNDIETQVKFLNKLVIVDSVLKSRYAFFESKFIKQFETPALLAAKDEQIKYLEYQNAKPNPLIWVVLALLSTSLLLLWYYKRRQAVYRKRFLQLQQRLNTPSQVRSLQESSKKIELSQDVIAHILKQLERFEKQQRFTNPDISLRFLAKKFNTNTNYLSRVINLKMEKNFSQYLNELRIDYIIEELNENSMARKYTIKALAEECGYTNAVSFSRAFYTKTGMKPSYYVENLKKSTA